MVSVFQTKTSEPQISVVGPQELPELWRDAVDGLNGPSLIESAAEAVVAHDVSVALAIDPTTGARTEYEVRIDAPSAPEFLCTRRASTRSVESAVTTGDERFDEAVVVETGKPKELEAFLTPQRRTIILQLLLRISTAEVTHESVRAWSQGVDQSEEKVARVMRRLVEVAESIAPSWVDAPLDAPSVLRDLFDSGRDIEAIAERFDTLYLGNTVSWAGEVLQVGAADRTGQRVAVFVGTADGRSADSGRVVALTALDPRIKVARGDVVTVTGSMWNLDPKNRFFRIE